MARSSPKDVVELPIHAEFPQQAGLTSCELVNTPWKCYEAALEARWEVNPRGKLRVYNDNGERQGIHLR